MSDTNDIRQMLCDTAQRLFTDHIDQKQLDAAKQTGWSSALWDELEKADLPLIGVPEEAHGAGGTLSDAAAVLRIAARHAAPVPLAETLIAGWLLASAGLHAPRGPMTVAAGGSAVHEGGSWRVSGTFKRVPFARAAKHLVVLAQGQVLVIDATLAQIRQGRNLASEARDDVTLSNAVALVEATTTVTPDALHARGALLRAVQTGGALERALQLSCEWATTREQFGRKIAQFQTIQQELARCGGEVAAVVAAALSAAGVVERLEGDAGPGAARQVLLAVASAKIRAADAAREAVAISHQVHGAIGATDEHALHHVTLRALAWREEFGNEVYWGRHLGSAMQAAGADQYWPLLSAA